MTRTAAGSGVFLAIASMIAAVLLLSAPASAAGPAPGLGASAPASPRDLRPDTRAADQGMRLDRRARVFEATGYQTLTVVGLAGGAMVIGALAAGAPGALTGAAAVVLVYTLMR